MSTTVNVVRTAKNTGPGVRQWPNWIDDVLADSFPASDPPSWTAGTARPAPQTLPRNSREADRPAVPADHASQGAFTMEAPVLQPGDQIPHFDVRNVQGQAISYSAIWQRKNLVLVTVPASDPLGSFSKYMGRLGAAIPALTALQTECVITRDVIAGTPCPGVVIADRWGEIVHVTGGSHVAVLPGPDELLEWIDYVQRQCPECQGEAK